MPQVVLEYSENCIHKDEFSVLFQKVHNVLSQTGGISLDNCKSRACQCQQFYIADGNPINAFCHLDIRFVEGRTDQIKNTIGTQCLGLLKDYFAESIEQQQMQITVEVRDILLKEYHKFPSATLTTQK